MWVPVGGERKEMEALDYSSMLIPLRGRCSLGFSPLLSLSQQYLHITPCLGKTGGGRAGYVPVLNTLHSQLFLCYE